MLNVYGPSGGGTDVDMASPDPPDSPIQDRPKKRKRTEWLEVNSTVILGARPRNFIILLAEKCQALDIQQAIQHFISVNSFSANDGTLLSLVAAHCQHTQSIDKHLFWQSVIEIQIALRCERFDYFWFERVWVYGSDHHMQYRERSQGYLGSQTLWFR